MASGDNLNYLKSTGYGLMVKSTHERRCNVTLSLKWNCVTLLGEPKTLKKKNVKLFNGVSLKVYEYLLTKSSQTGKSYWRNEVNVLKLNRWLRSRHSIANDPDKWTVYRYLRENVLFPSFGILGSSQNLLKKKKKVLTDVNFKQKWQICGTLGEPRNSSGTFLHNITGCYKFSVFKVFKT